MKSCIDTCSCLIVKSLQIILLLLLLSASAGKVYNSILAVYNRLLENQCSSYYTNTHTCICYVTLLIHTAGGGESDGLKAEI